MAMSINELRTKRASLWEETKKFLADHTDKDGKMTAADAEAYEKMEAYLSGQAYRKTLDLLSAYRTAMNVPPDEAYRDFSANSADYYALLENIGITVTERSLIYSSVPAALASEIE